LTNSINCSTPDETHDENINADDETHDENINVDDETHDENINVENDLMEGVGLTSVSEALCQPSTDLILQTDQLAVVPPDAQPPTGRRPILMLMMKLMMKILMLKTILWKVLACLRSPRFYASLPPT
jgi:hypothetical protein